MTTVRNKVIVKPCLSDSISAGGLIVPDSFLGRSSKAVVVAVGPGNVKTPMKIKSGVICLHIIGAGEEIEEGGERYFVMNDTDILATY